MILRTSLAALALTGAALSARAETPLVSLVLGDEFLHAYSGDVTSAAASFDTGGYPGVTVRLLPVFDEQVAALTASHIGERLDFLICGKVKSQPVLLTELSTAEFLITTDSLEEASRLVALLKTADCGSFPGT